MGRAGGRILPARDFIPPDEFTEWPLQFGWAALRDVDLGEFAVSWIVHPTARTWPSERIFGKYGGSGLTWALSRKVQGEDTEFCQRLMRAGERLRYEPSAIVRIPCWNTG